MEKRDFEGTAMYRKKDLDFNGLLTRRREHLMEHRMSGVRIALLWALLVLPALSAWAATEVTAANYTTNSSGDVIITLLTDGDDPIVSVFATESPARIILDLADTNSNVGTSPVSVGIGSVQKFTTLGAGGRTRVMVDLSKPVAYDYQTRNGEVVLSIAGNGMGSTAPRLSSTAKFNIENIDFRRGEDGQSTVIISLDQGSANISVSPREGGLSVDVFDTSLPQALNQRLDVVDFATPIQTIDSNDTGNTVRVELEVSGLYEHMAYQSGNDWIIEVSKLAALSVGAGKEVLEFYEEKEYEGSRVTFNFQDIPVRSVLQLIADVSDLNIVVAEQQLLQALQDRKELEPLATALISVSYASAEDLQTLITEASSGDSGEAGLLSERGSVAIDSRTNTLMITDTPDRIEAIQKLVLDLDRPVRQVQIESRIVIASSDFAHAIGVRFGVTALHNGRNILGVSGNGISADTVRNDQDVTSPNVLGRYNVNLPVTESGAGSIGLSFLAGNVLLDLELTALEAEGDGEVISTPRVVTANQSEAFIQQGVEIPYEQAASSGATAVQFKEAVLELRATPLITPDNRVQLDLQIKQDTVGEIFETGRGGSVPSIDTRELNTSVLVNNGETVVLGGIFQDERSRQEDRVPYLSSIPGIGNLFKRRSNQTKKRELLIFVTPTIVEDRPVVN